MDEKFANIETMLDFVKKYTPCINGETTMECVERSIRNAPTIEAKPVVHAHWIVTSNGEDKWVNKCSACGGFLKRGQKQTNFCPNCGAQMPGGTLKNNTQKDVPKIMEEMEK